MSLLGFNVPVKVKWTYISTFVSIKNRVIEFVNLFLAMNL